MERARIVIVGGGLAGMAAATALSAHGLAPILLEAKRRVGGRAGSFEDPTTGEIVDHCQHAAMGCCTNFLDFCRRVGMIDRFRVDRTLHFLSPEGRRSDMVATPLLPAPLHLASSFLGLRFLSWRSRSAVAFAVRDLIRLTPEQAAGRTVAAWLADIRQPVEAIERFWKVVLVSALGDDLDRASLAVARKVLVDGFLAHRDAYRVLIPLEPLDALYETHVLPHLSRSGTSVRLSSAVESLCFEDDTIRGVRLTSGEEIPADAVIVATAWRPAAKLLRGTPGEAILSRHPFDRLESSPITGVHLWFDRPITKLPHAVLVGRLSQWIFQRPIEGELHYYQVVISASRALAVRNASDVLAEILADLRVVFPATATAELRHSRLVTQQEAVFSPTTEGESIRPSQLTPIRGLFLAGDWTATGWPATMESAVRSGYLAAEGVLAIHGEPKRLLVADLAASRWLKWIQYLSPFSP